MKPTKTLISTLAAIAIIGLIAGIAVAGGFSVIQWSSPGLQRAPISGVAKPVYADVYGGVLTTGTVIISRISPDMVYTQAIHTLTASSGAAAAAITNAATPYITAGDFLLRSGTVTNASPVRLILQGQ